MDIGAWGAWSHKESDMVEPIDDVMKIKKKKIRSFHKTLCYVCVYV